MAPWGYLQFTIEVIIRVKINSSDPAVVRTMPSDDRLHGLLVELDDQAEGDWAGKSQDSLPSDSSSTSSCSFHPHHLALIESSMNSFAGALSDDYNLMVQP